ncbi:MAG: AraC family transcriptional regulator [Planctomycetes bacterium]|nr:AraC family transcriptional regulator [Planctomycetota bacterium]
MVRLGTSVQFESGELQVVATHWRRDEHPSSSTAETPTAIVELLDRGSFVQQRRADRECVDRNAIAYFNPEERFRVEHPIGAENSGLWIRIGAAWWETTGRELGLPARDPRSPFRRSTAMSTFAVDVARRRLARRVSEGAAAEPLGVEEALLDVVVHALDAHEGASPSRPVSGQLAGRVEAARLFLAEHHRRRLRLVDIAAAVGGSPYPLCRAFAAVTGRSLHRHVVSLRLRGALDEIEAGCRDLTELALRSGFASHAHFTACFRAAYGVAPSHARGQRRTRR